MSVKSIAVLAAAISGLALAETPDKFVRYVESTGSQDVDTGVQGRWNTKVEAQVEWMELGDKINEIEDDFEDTSSALENIHAEMETQLDALEEALDEE